MHENRGVPERNGYYEGRETFRNVLRSALHATFR